MEFSDHQKSNVFTKNTKNKKKNFLFSSNFQKQFFNPQRNELVSLIRRDSTDTNLSFETK